MIRMLSIAGFVFLVASLFLPAYYMEMGGGVPDQLMSYGFSDINNYIALVVALILWFISVRASPLLAVILIPLIGLLFLGYISLLKLLVIWFGVHVSVFAYTSEAGLLLLITSFLWTNIAEMRKIKKPSDQLVDQP